MVFHFSPGLYQGRMDLVGFHDPALLDTPMVFSQGVMHCRPQNQAAGNERFRHPGHAIEVIRQRAPQELGNLAIAPMRPIDRGSGSSI